MPLCKFIVLFVHIGSIRTINKSNHQNDMFLQMLGEMPGSIEAARRATQINAQHSQAYAGLGLVYSDMNQYKKAAESFRKCLSLNPWSPVSSRLTMCLDTMKRLELEEDEE